MLLGPPWRDMGEPGALANNDCSDVFDGVPGEGQAMVQDAASNKDNRATRLIAVGILAAEVTQSPFVLYVRRFGAAVSSNRVFFS